MLHIFQHGIYFNPLPPHGGRLSYCAMCTISTYFNPLPPHGGRLHTGVNFVDCFLFQSTPSAWRETCYFLYLLYHAEHFNPLPPHGGRLGTQTEKNRSEVFQSTPSAWRETSDMRKCYHCIFISIHSLRMEGDCSKLLTWRRRQGFQSTPSAWRETMSVQKL